MAALCKNSVLRNDSSQSLIDRRFISLVKAPLTIVRSEIPRLLKISIIFDGQFKPLNPIYPSPTEISLANGALKYTWSILTCRNGTMFCSRSDKSLFLIKMIWWEILRLGIPPYMDSRLCACISRNEVKEFLTKTLLTLGVRESEMSAFTSYWDDTFNKDPFFLKYPYLLVQLIEPDDLHRFVPKMVLEGTSAAQFAIKRFFFRFKPVEDTERGKSPERFIFELIPHVPDPNAVIDLGGEVVPENFSSPQISGMKEPLPGYVDSFIKKFILV